MSDKGYMVDGTYDWAKWLAKNVPEEIANRVHALGNRWWMYDTPVALKLC